MNINEFIDIIKCIEYILLYTGSYLSNNIIIIINNLIEISLNSILKGIYIENFNDRRMKRSNNHSLLRNNSLLQYSILSLGLISLLNCSQNNIINSYNISLLKDTAFICLKTNNHNLNEISNKILLIIDMILHPIKVILPSIPIINEIKNFHNKINDFQENLNNKNKFMTENNNESVTENVTENMNENMNESVTENETEIIIETTKIIKENPIIINEKISKKRKNEEIMESIPKIAKLNNIKPVIIHVPAEEADADDDSLPDINVEDDPDV